MFQPLNKIYAMLSFLAIIFKIDAIQKYYQIKIEFFRICKILKNQNFHWFFRVTENTFRAIFQLSPFLPAFWPILGRVFHVSIIRTFFQKFIKAKINLTCTYCRQGLPSQFCRKNNLSKLLVFSLQLL